jgi:hypothetical protein
MSRKKSFCAAIEENFWSEQAANPPAIPTRASRMTQLREHRARIIWNT